MRVSVTLSEKEKELPRKNYFILHNAVKRLR